MQIIRNATLLAFIYAFIAGVGYGATTNKAAKALKRGKEACERGDYDGAIAAFSDAVQLDPKYADAYYNRGCAYSLKSRHDKAIADYSTALQFDPLFADIYMWRAYSYAVKGLNEKALAGYSKAIQLNPQLADAYVGRGDMYGIKGLHNKAIANYSHAIRLDPKNVKAYYSRGYYYTSRGEHEEAIAGFSEAIRLNPKLADAYYGRGRVYGRQGKYNKAIADYSKVLQLDPKLANAHVGRGNIYVVQELYDKAIADFIEAIRLDPKNVIAYYKRGRSYAAKGEHDKAIADFTEAIRLDPNHAAAYTNRGKAYDHKGDSTKRDADFARAREIRAKAENAQEVMVPVVAPVTYKELMLVLSNEKGVVAIAFTEEIQYGVKFQYRFLPKDGKEKSGKSSVSAVYKRPSDDSQSKTEMIVNGGAIKAGQFNIAWSHAQQGKGYIYYHPELVCVQIADPHNYEKIDLRRFASHWVADKGIADKDQKTDSKGRQKVWVFPPGFDGPLSKNNQPNRRINSNQ